VKDCLVQSYFNDLFKNENEKDHLSRRIVQMEAIMNLSARRKVAYEGYAINA
jgi:hypothetical protein